MNMGIHKAGSGPLSRAVYELASVNIEGSRMTYESDSVAVDTDVSGIDFAGEDIDEIDISDCQIQGAITTGGFY
jgi:hypothetical protein